MAKHKRTKHATDVTHHQHMRKRLSKKDFRLSLIDHLVYIAGPLIPIAIAPTAYNVWVNGETEGIVLTTWVILTVTSTVMALYAIVHRAKPLILTYIPLALLNFSVVIGVLIKA